MGWFLIIFAALAVGVICGIKVNFSDKTLKRISRMMDWTILLLVFTMGFRLGNNRELLSQLDEIGFMAFLVCLAGMVGTAIALHFAIEKKEARHRKHIAEVEAEEKASAGKENVK